MKKIFAFLLALTLMFTNGIAVLAEEVDMPPADQISSNPNYASYTWIAPLNGGSQAGTNEVGQDGLSIVMIQASISKGGNTVSAVARTDSNIFSDMYTSIHIQRWKNNKWNYYLSAMFVECNTCSVTETYSASVESGYYYRVVVHHRASTLYSTVTATSTTASVYVN